MADDVGAAAALLEQLLTDADFRARFRRDPAQACRERGLHELAEDMGAGGKAMHTLEVRESKSSLAGVMLAAAAEGVSAAALLDGSLLDGEAAAAVRKALTLPRLQSVRGALGSKGSAVPGAALPRSAASAARSAADAGAAPPGSATGATPPAPAPGAAPAGAPPQSAGAAPSGATGAAPSESTASPGAAPSGSAASAAPSGSTSPASPGSAAVGAPPGVSAAGAPPQTGAGSAWPTPDSVDPDFLGGDIEDTDAEPAAPAAEAAAATGSDASAKGLLDNPKLDVSPGARADLEAGAVDPRLVAVLAKLTQEHEVGLSVIKTGHDKFVAGTTSVSNHFHGRGVDISSIDGQPVSPANDAAREVAGEIAAMTGPERPSEIGSPWAMSAPGAFTDAGHQDHIHLGYDGEAPADFKSGGDSPAHGEPDGHSHGADPEPSGDSPAHGEPDGHSHGADPEPSGDSPAATDGQPGDSGPRAADGEPSRGSSAAPPATEDDPDKPAGTAAFEAIAPRETSFRRDTATFLRAAEPKAAPASADAPEVDLAGAPGDYPGDDAPREQLARWLGAEAKKAGLPPELPVMAALVESGLKNLNYGDADSVGFFQMRTSIWNKGEYAGYDKRPELQAKWFIDTALAVKQQRVAQGRGDELTDPSRWGEWIADVERPAAQYRGRYQPKLAEARALLGGG